MTGASFDEAEDRSTETPGWQRFFAGIHEEESEWMSGMNLLEGQLATFSEIRRDGWRELVQPGEFAISLFKIILS